MKAKRRERKLKIENFVKYDVVRHKKLYFDHFYIETSTKTLFVCLAYMCMHCIQHRNLVCKTYKKILDVVVFKSIFCSQMFYSMPKSYKYAIKIMYALHTVV